MDWFISVSGLLLCAGIIFLLAYTVRQLLRDTERRAREQEMPTGDGSADFVGSVNGHGGRKNLDANDASGDGDGFSDGGSGNGGGGGD